MATVIYCADRAAGCCGRLPPRRSTRVDAIAEEQAEKAKAVGPEGPSDAERIIRRILLSPLLSGGEGLYPWFGSVFGGTGMGLGAGYLKRFENASHFNLQTGISINNSTVLRGGFAAPALWRGKMQFDTSGQWLDARDVSFYGFGQDSAPEDARALRLHAEGHRRQRHRQAACASCP